MQITPSEFQNGDKLLSDVGNNIPQWRQAYITKHQVPAGEVLVYLSTQRGQFFLTPGHKIFRGDGSLEAAGNLKKGDTLKFSSCISLPDNQSIGIDMAYSLGTFGAEGYTLEGVGKDLTGRWRAVWCLNYNEECFSTKIYTSIISAFPNCNCQIDKYLEYTRRTVSCYDKDIVSKLKELGATGYCDEKRVPSIIFTATRFEKAAYIAGLIEGDGTWNVRRIRLKLTSKFLIDGTHLLLEDLGIFNCLGLDKDKDGNDVFTLTIYGKENLALFLKKCSRYLYGWKHLESVQKYAESQYGNISHTYADIARALEKLYPSNCVKFSNLSGIPQASIKRIFGSWNRCLLHFGYKVKNSKWGKVYNPQILPETEKPKYNQVNEVRFVVINKPITVYDFTVPETSNFFINTICSHNSGAQVQLFLGDVWIDEMTSFSYNLIQSKTPLYGYASQFFDTTAAGRILVQGSLSINFKEQGYLWAVLRRYFNVSAVEAGVKSTKKDDNLLRVKKNSSRTMPDIVNKSGNKTGSNGTNISRASIERITQGKMTTGEQYKFYHDLASYATFDVKNPKDKVFEDIVEAFEDEVWAPTSTNEGLSSQIRRVDDNRFDGFDIYLVMGNYSNPKANHTVRKIVGVRLMSEGKQIVINGAPISEQYSWIAQTVV